MIPDYIKHSFKMNHRSKCEYKLLGHFGKMFGNILKASYDPAVPIIECKPNINGCYVH